MKHPQRIARLAGLCYLGVVLTGIFSLMYVPTQLFDWENPTATLAQIRAGELLFRAGIVASLMCYLFFALLPMILYRLLSPVHTLAAQIMVLLASLSIPIAVVSTHYEIQILKYLTEPAYLATWTSEQVAAMVLQALSSFGSGLNTADIFWSSWLFPFGYLVFRSTYFPKWLGILLMVGSGGYFVHTLSKILIPGFAETTIASVLRSSASIAEIGTCLWLLIVGVRQGDRMPITTG